jgi:hypothetical protein
MMDKTKERLRGSRMCCVYAVYFVGARNEKNEKLNKAVKKAEDKSIRLLLRIERYAEDRCE